MTNELPIACDLSAMTADQRARHTAIRARIEPRIQGVEDRPDGYVLLLPGDADTILHAAEFTTLERLCCPFMAFRLEIGAPDVPLRLIASGPDGTKEFLELEFQLQVTD